MTKAFFSQCIIITSPGDQTTHKVILLILLNNIYQEKRAGRKTVEKIVGTAKLGLLLYQEKTMFDPGLDPINIT